MDHCEISAFAHAGISLGQGDGHRIHHNFIHHCQYNGLGYGISHDQASSLIECNRFDWNRHSIAGTGRPGCSYVARNNVELGESLSHCFDMHGGRDRKDGTDIAGTSIEISHNTFRAPQPAVVIRGVPEKQCDVHHNWFTRHAQPQQAVHAGAKTSVAANAYGAEAKVDLDNLDERRQRRSASAEGPLNEKVGNGRRLAEQPGTAPNAGPATAVGNTGVTDGPPSVT